MSKLKCLKDLYLKPFCNGLKKSDFLFKCWLDHVKVQNNLSAADY